MKKGTAKRKLALSRETLGNLDLEKLKAGQRISDAGNTVCATNCTWCY